MPVQTLKIKNFKSIKQLDLDCKRVNLFIGEPNTGKSNILEAIGLLSHLVHGSIVDFVRFEVMTDLFYDHILEDSIILSFNDQNVQVDFKDGRFHGFRMLLNRKQDLFDYAYDGDGSIYERPADFRIFKFYRFIKRSAFKNPMSEFLHPPNGDNLLAVIMSNKRLRTIVKEIFDKFGYKVVFRPQEGKIEVQKELEDILFAFPYSLASETLQRVVFYLAAIYSNRDSVLTFEEPEAHAFPYYTKYLAERISLNENNNQYFVSTHNPYFLTSVLEKTPKEEVAIFVTSLENYQTKVKTLTEAKKQEILDMGYDVFFNIEKLIS